MQFQSKRTFPQIKFRLKSTQQVIYYQYLATTIRTTCLCGPSFFFCHQVQIPSSLFFLNFISPNLYQLYLMLYSRIFYSNVDYGDSSTKFKCVFYSNGDFWCFQHHLRNGEPFLSYSGEQLQSSAAHMISTSSVCRPMRRQI